MDLKQHGGKIAALVLLLLLGVAWGVGKLAHRAFVSAALADQPETLVLEPIGFGASLATISESFRQARDEMAQLDFEPIGRFDARELQIELMAYANPRTRSYAVIYFAAGFPAWIDMSARFEDGSRITVTSSDKADDLDVPPYHRLIMLEGASAKTLYTRLLAEIGDRALLSAEPEQFEEAIRQAYARDRAWLIQRYGL